MSPIPLKPKNVILILTMRKDIFIKTTALDEALSLWKARMSGTLKPLESVAVRVQESLGRVTGAPVIARISSPFYHASAMDGYAVRFTETFGAAETTPLKLDIGAQAVYVDTGDPIPEGFNAVVMTEDANPSDDHIEIIAPVTPWENVRTVGEDIVATELILPEGQRISPPDMGAMLAGGLTEVMVRRKPRIAVIPTGTEIVNPGTELKPGDIIEFNSTVLGGLVEQWGGEFVRFEPVPDRRELILDAVKKAASMADMVVINAGASAGSEDFTESVILELGELYLHGLAIRPGKPAMLGQIDGRPVIGTPGYPVATYTVFNLFARPVIMAWLGLDDNAMGHGSIKAKLSRPVSSALGSEEFVRVKLGRVGENLIATPLGRGAGLMMTLVRSDGILRIPAMSEGLGAGAMIDIELSKSRDAIENTIVSIGSHDSAMDMLGNFLKRRHPRYSLSSAHVGSMGGLIALKKGEAHIAPTHLLDEETGLYNTPFLKRILPEREVVLVTLVERTQGLMVTKGNPKGIKGLEDLRRPDITFINRQRGAGTRLLLDKCLKELGIDTASIAGYAKEEYTHMAVASAVLTAVADTGLGVLSAANALGLEFIPVAQERYDLAIPADLMETDMIRALLGIIREDDEFRRALEAMGGYGLTLMGKTVAS